MTIKLLLNSELGVKTLIRFKGETELVPVSLDPQDW
jgi:hypothetical protein